MVICIELYTYNPNTQRYTYIIIHYMLYESSVMSLHKKLKFFLIKLSFDAYNGLKNLIVHHIIPTYTVMHI